MTLTYSGRGDRRDALTAFGVAIVCALVGLLGFVVGWPLLIFVAVLSWCASLALLAIGIVLLAASLRPVHITVDESGIDIHGQGMDVTLPWSKVEAISVQTLLSPPPRPDLDTTVPPPQEVLVLWPEPDVQMRHPPTFPAGGSGPKGHVLVELKYLLEPRAQIEDILRHYAKERFRSLSTA